MVSFKEQKEAAVTGFEGTSPQELLLIVVVAPVISYWLFCLVALDRNDHTKQRAAATTSSTSSTSFWSSSSWHFLSSILLEAAILWFPMILCQSVYLYPYGVLYLVLQVLLSIRMERTRRRRRRRRKRHDKDVKQHSIEKDSSAYYYSYGYVTVYRCMGLYLTFVAILAVDFGALFPRRLVKTETHGYSLMDLGASFAVMAAGLCSSRARRQQQSSSINARHQHQHQQQQNDTWKRILLNRMGPLLFMGCLRLIVHGGIEYQEHVSEYGVHWNFFFTMATLAIIPRLVSSMFGQDHRPPSWILPLSIMVLYQYSLEYAYLPLKSSSSSHSSIANDPAAVRVVPLKLWIEEAPRSCTSRNGISSSSFAMVVNVTSWFVCDFLVANREGLLGCIGYTSLYLTSEWIGHDFVWNNNRYKNKRTTSPYSLWLLGFDFVLLWRFLVLKSTTAIGLFGLECSRRSTNAIFILWTLVVNVLVLSTLQAIHDYYFYQHYDNKNGKSTNEDKNKRNNYIFKQSQPIRQPMSGTTILIPVVWAAVNRHGLLCFIAANLLTGILNLTIPNMLEISGITALAILTIYMTAIGLLALLLDAGIARSKSTARLPAPTNDDASTNAKAKAE